MAEINVGRVRIGWKGEWDETTEYKALDAVTFEGSSYVATVDPPVGTAPTSAAFWQLMAEKGADGPPGERGPQGPEGPAGTNDWDQLVDVPENLAYIGTGASQVRSNSALDGRFVQGQAGTAGAQFRNNQQNDGRFVRGQAGTAATQFRNNQQNDARYDERYGVLRGTVSISGALIWSSNPYGTVVSSKKVSQGKYEITHNLDFWDVDGATVLLTAVSNTPALIFCQSTSANVITVYSRSLEGAAKDVSFSFYISLRPGD